MKTIIRELLVEDVKGDAEVAYALLASEHSLFVLSKLEQASDKLILEASLDDMYDWSALETMIVEEKLRHLLNLSELFDQLSDSKFTYSFTPDNLVFNRNAEPQLIFRGIKDQVPPYQPLEREAFVNTLKSHIAEQSDAIMEVSPHTGEWIEIRHCELIICDSFRLALCGRVD